MENLDQILIYVLVALVLFIVILAFKNGGKVSKLSESLKEEAKKLQDSFHRKSFTKSYGNRAKKEAKTSVKTTPIDKQEGAFEELNALKKSIQRSHSTGERYLTKLFMDLFESGEFDDLTVYHSVKFMDRNQFKELDFLVVSKKGVVILESKHWKGTTYIYEEGGQDPFKNTQFSEFAIGQLNPGDDEKMRNMRVFTLRESERTSDLTLRQYPNPLLQVRSYSAFLYNQLRSAVKELLGDKKLYVRNCVVFHKGKDCELIFNNTSVENREIDWVTHVITDNALKEYLQSLSDDWNDETREKICETIDESFSYHYKMDKSTFDTSSKEQKQYLKTFVGSIR